MNIINKFKLYKYKVKLDKYKLVKDTSLVLIPVVLISTAIPLINKFDKFKEKNVSGYTSEYNQNDYYNNYGNNYEAHSENNNIETNTTENNGDSYNNDFNSSLDLDDYAKTIIGSNVSLSTLDLNGYINGVNSIEVHYKYSDIYNMENEFLKYESIDKYTSKTPSLFKNGTITAETIFNIVKNNNSNTQLAASAKISDSNLLEVCNVMASLLNDVVKTNKNIDLNLLSEKINNLKIITIDEFSNGFFDPETCKMGFNFSLLKSKENDFYKQTIEHEVYHFIQSNSLNEIKNTEIKNRFGFTYEYKDAKINPFAWNWFYEGAAEYLTCNRNNTNESNVYESVIKDFDTIKVCTLLMPQNDTASFENLSLSNDINDLFNYFGCQTRQEKIEILNMMYSLNIKHNLGLSCENFYDTYENVYGKTISSSNLRRELNDDIAQTQTKYFYKSLANALINKNVKVEEIFGMISVFENEISRSIWYNSNQSSLTEFYQTYDKIQTDFFQLIAESLGIKVEDVQEAYNSYNKHISVNLDNVTLLTDDQKEFYNYILSTREGDKMNSINYVFEKYNSMQR